jgi:hypothetical protein
MVVDACGQFASSLTNVGSDHAPPGKPLHWPVECSRLRTKSVPFQVH